jgi:tetratricopeptide (TPR) repeat protein/transglutaminase-like putative cysteine protease
MHRFLRIASGVLLVCATGWPSHGSDLPAWRDAPAFTTPAADLLEASAQLPARPGYDGAYLLDDVQVVLDEASRRTTTVHCIFRLDRETALAALGNARAPWSDWYEERPVIRARVITADGMEHPLDPATIGVFQAQVRSPELLTDRKELRAPLPALARGAVAEVEVVVREFRPFSSSGTRDNYNFVSVLPAQHMRFSLDAPGAAAVHWLAQGLKDQEVSRASEAGRARYRVETGPVLPLKPQERLQAYDQEEPPFIVYSTVPSWNAVAREYLAIVETQIKGTELPAWAQPAKGKGEDRAAIVDHLVRDLRRNVRYTGLEFGEASIVPRPPAEVLKRGYGDCKDQACLLVALLRGRGIEAQVALMRAGILQPFKEEMPGLVVFNHAIVVLPGKHPVWIDPSARYARAGTLPGPDQGRQALVIARTTTGPVATPQDPAAQNVTRRSFDVVMTDAGLAQVTLSLTGSGPSETRLRGAFASADPAHLPPHLKTALVQECLSRELESVECHDPDDLLHPFQLTARAMDSKFASTGVQDGSAALSPWLLVTDLDTLIQEPRGDPQNARGGGEGSNGPNYGSPATRRTDLLLPEAYAMEGRWLIHPPEGFGPSRLPERRTVAFGPASLVCSYASTPAGAVEVTCRFECERLRWTPSEVMEARRALDTFRAEQVPMVRFQPKGMADLNAGRLQEGLAEFRKGVAANPGKAAPLLRLSRAQLMAGLGESARASALKATELEPGSPRAFEGLAWALENDSLGRPHSHGWDRPAAVAANRKALALDPHSRSARWQLAMVLERDALGGRLTAGPDLDEAIELYRALLAEEKNETLTGNLAAALAYRGRFAEARELLYPFRGAPKWSGWLVAATACAQGLEEALAQADRDIPDPSSRWQALLVAGDLCAQFRHFVEAAGLTEAGAPGSRQATQTRNWAQRLAKVQPYNPGRVPPRDPKSAPIRFLARILDPAFDPDQVRATVAEAVRPMLDEAQMLRTRRKWLGAPLYSGLSTQSILDVLASTLEITADGTDQRGYRVRLQGQGYRQSWAIAAEGGAYRPVLSSDDSASGLGWQARALLDRGDAVKAAAWLDLAMDLLPDGNPKDSLSRPPLKVVRAQATSQGTEELRLEAACLEAFGTADAATVARLEAGFRNSASRAVRGAAGMALASALHRKGDWAALAEHTRDLASQFPGYPSVLAWRARALACTHGWEDLLLLADHELVSNPGQVDWVLKQVKALAGLGRYPEANRSIAGLKASGRLGPGEWNDLAWAQVEAGWVSPQTLEYARNATQDPTFQTRESMHTLAAVLAELGRVAEAREALQKSLDLDGADEPWPQDWYVLGRIAEKLDDPQVAETRYALVRATAAHENPDKSACALLAQSRIQFLDPAAPAAPQLVARPRPEPGPVPEPSDQDCRAFYRDHPDRFTTGGTFDCRCILLRLPDPKAEQKIGKIMAELKAGRSFAALARTWSDDPVSKNRGGLYQDIPPGRFPKAFEDAVFSQKVGAVGRPVQTPFGTFLILVEKVRPGVLQPYEEVKAQVRSQALEARSAP